MGCVEQVVFYNDVQFIKGGWINRNQILFQQTAKPFRLSLVDASSNKRINEVLIYNKNKEVELLKKTMFHAYGKAPNYEPVSSLIQDVLEQPTTSIAEIAEFSIRMVFQYLNLPFSACRSSEIQFNREATNKTDRLISLIKHFGKTHYVNAIGGKELYSKDYFLNQGIQLHFIAPANSVYKQFNHVFIPGLSMIDVLMFNDIQTIRAFLEDVEFE